MRQNKLLSIILAIIEIIIIIAEITFLIFTVFLLPKLLGATGNLLNTTADAITDIVDYDSNTLSNFDTNTVSGDVVKLFDKHFKITGEVIAVNTELSKITVYYQPKTEDETDDEDISYGQASELPRQAEFNWRSEMETDANAFGVEGDTYYYVDSTGTDHIITKEEYDKYLNASSSSNDTESQDADSTESSQSANEVTGQSSDNNTYTFDDNADDGSTDFSQMFSYNQSAVNQTVTDTSVVATKIDNSLQDEIQKYMDGNPVELMNVANISGLDIETESYYYTYNNVNIPLFSIKSDETLWYTFVPEDLSSIVIKSNDPVIITDEMVTPHYDSASESYPDHYTFNTYQYQAIGNTRAQHDDVSVSNIDDINRNVAPISNSSNSASKPTAGTGSSLSSVTPSNVLNGDTNVSAVSYATPEAAEQRKALLKALSYSYDKNGKSTEDPNVSIDINSNDNMSHYILMSNIEDPSKNVPLVINGLRITLGNLSNLDSNGKPSNTIKMTISVVNTTDETRPYVIAGYLVSSAENSTKKELAGVAYYDSTNTPLQPGENASISLSFNIPASEQSALDGVIINAF